MHRFCGMILVIHVVDLRAQVQVYLLLLTADGDDGNGLLCLRGHKWITACPRGGVLSGKVGTGMCGPDRVHF